MELKSIFGTSSQGPYLQINEDCYHLELESELYLLFDGFGGVGKGDACVDYLKDKISHQYQNSILDRNSTLPFYYSSKYLLETNILINASLAAHHDLIEENQKKNLSLRSGASAVLLAKSENSLTFFSTGNCRSYLIRDGKIKIIFGGDSLADYQSETEQNCNTIALSGFGLFPELHYEINEHKIIEGDIVILATDGMYSRLNNEEVLSTIYQSNLSLEERLSSLFEKSNTRGNLDNQSCIILEF